MKTFLIGLVVVVLALVVVGLFLPTEYNIERSVVIEAEPAEVHELLDDLRRWREWGPWYDADPTIETKYGEKTAGVGAHMNWTGKDGAGELDMTRSDPATGIAYKMVFFRGEDPSPAAGWMDYERVENGTKVTWGMKGDFDMPVIGGWLKIFILPSFKDMFDDGLAKLKARVENQAG